MTANVALNICISKLVLTLTTENYTFLNQIENIQVSHDKMSPFTNS